MATDFKELKLDSIDVANAIRYAGQLKDLRLNMTQINKLLYIVYGSWLVLHKERLTAEHPAAWPYGPVFPRVHRHVKLYEDPTPSSYNELKTINSDITRLIDIVVNTFGRLPAGKLSEWSHQPDSPWDIAIRQNNAQWNAKLDDEDIFNYFYNVLKIGDDGGK